MFHSQSRVAVELQLVPPSVPLPRISYGEALQWLDEFGLLDGRSSLLAFIAQAVHFGYAEQWCTVTFTNAHRKRQRTIPALLVVELEFVLTAVIVQPRIVHHRLYWLLSGSHGASLYSR